MRDRLTGCEVTYPRGFSSARLLIRAASHLLIRATDPRCLLSARLIRYPRD
jgi:hypothetical protein